MKYITKEMDITIVINGEKCHNACVYLRRDADIVGSDYTYTCGLFRVGLKDRYRCNKCVGVFVYGPSGGL